MANILGDKIRTLRKEKKLTLEQLAEQSGSSKSYIWELENKNPPRPSGEKVANIAKALGVTSDYLLSDSEMSPEPDVLDEAFFRKYRAMDEKTKAKFRSLIDVWDDEG